MFISDGMEKIVEIPDNVEIEIDKFKISVKGSKGSLERDFDSPLFNKDISVKKEDNKVLVSTKSEKKKIKAMIGTIVAHIRNMIVGVMEGYTVKLKIVYMHFPFRIEVSGDEISVNNFLGEKIPRKTKIVGGCKVEVKGDEITVIGIDKEAVGLTAANLERATHIKSRDRRVFQDGIFRVD
jgi:large subunit ribosomal protein L6